MKPVLLQVGAFPVHSYGVMIVVGTLLAATLVSLRARARGVPAEWIWDIAMVGLAAGVVGARLGFLLFERPDLLAQPKEAIAVWRGGMVFYAGLLLATIACVRYIHWRGLSLGVVADLCAPGIPLAHAFSRVGCFLAGCCYGAPVSWGVRFPVLGDGVPRHPTQLYEAAGCLLLFGIVWSLRNRPRTYEGQLLLLYLILYAVMRFCLEFLRADDRGGSPFLGLSASQAIALLAAGTAGFIHLVAKHSRWRAFPAPW